MRSAALILTFGFTAVLLQTTLLRLVALGSVTPDLVLVLAVYLGLHYQQAGGAAGAFCLGYLLDTFSGANFGVNAFATSFVFFFVYVLSRRLWIEGRLVNSLVVLTAAFAKTLAVAGLLAASSSSPSGSQIWGDLLSGAMAAALTPAIFGAVEQGKRWMRLT
jgi:rod shape-determining protein MreD